MRVCVSVNVCTGGFGCMAPSKFIIYLSCVAFGLEKSAGLASLHQKNITVSAFVLEVCLFISFVSFFGIDASGSHRCHFTLVFIITVSLERITAIGFILAKLTLELFLVLMLQLVRGEVILAHEVHVALVTFEWSLARMLPHVTRQLGRADEHFAAFLERATMIARG